MTFDFALSIAGIIGILGFILSVVNLIRQSPSVFVVSSYKSYQVGDGRPLEFAFEIVNAGASGVSITAVEVTGPNDPASHVNQPAIHSWFGGLELPLRLEPYGAHLMTLDVAEYKKFVFHEGMTEFDLVVEYFGRPKILHLLERDRSKKIGYKRSSIRHRRRRTHRTRFSIANQVFPRADPAPTDVAE